MQVEANPNISNQHEFDGVAGFKKILGPEKKKFPAFFMYFGEDEDETCTAEGFLTWYDARENHPSRSEFRLYFPSTSVSERAAAEDTLIIGKKPDGTILVVIAQSASTSENQLLWLFGLQHDEALAASRFAVKEIGEGNETSINYASKLILEHIGIEIDEEDESYLDILLQRFPDNLPTTREFSRFARETLKSTNQKGNPDHALLKWMEQEEMLFKTLEKHMVGKRLRDGFADNIDDFMVFSLSVHNRRKSRAGYAFENHLEHIFIEQGIKYSRGHITEHNSKPDFIFPGISEYRNPQFPVERLAMLALKTTCKDRWRQVLAEAARIPAKHLATLETGITVNQTNEMMAHKLTLVLPKGLHETYSTSQQRWLMSIEDFISYLRTHNGE